MEAVDVETLTQAGFMNVQPMHPPSLASCTYRWSLSTMFIGRWSLIFAAGAFWVGWVSVTVYSVGVGLEDNSNHLEPIVYTVEACVKRAERGRAGVVKVDGGWGETIA